MTSHPASSDSTAGGTGRQQPQDPAAGDLDAEEARLQALLDGVWQRRRHELLSRFADLGDAVLLLARAGGHDGGAAEQGAAEAHRLAGALGSLGFDALAGNAAGLERALALACDGPAEGEALEAAVRSATRLGQGLSAARTRPAR